MARKHSSTTIGRLRRKIRVRKRIFGTSERPRLSVFRSAKHMGVQVIDDDKGHTLAGASTYGKNASNLAQGSKLDQAKAVGLRIAQICQDKGIKTIVFDRNRYKYHGCVRAIAESAREGGLRF